MNINKFTEKLLDFGINEYEINNLTELEAICYCRFHHGKHYGQSSILFLGFSDEEITSLSKKTEKLNFIINKRISERLTFLCANENADFKRILKSKEYGTIILTKDDFETFLSNNNYILDKSEFIYDNSIQSEFRIIKPLSNFNKNIYTESFSIDSEDIYTVNLYNGTCTCQDFIKKNRLQFPTGDVRRFCKHLLSEYKNSFGLTGLTEFQKSIFENGYPMKKKCQNIYLENISLPVILNYEENEEWYNIFVPKKNGLYERYGYSSIDKRFSNNDKPHGLVTELKLKLNEVINTINLNEQKKYLKKSNEKKEERNNKKTIEKPKGCLIIFFLTIFSFAYYIL